MDDYAAWPGFCPFVTRFTWALNGFSDLLRVNLFHTWLTLNLVVGGGERRTGNIKGNIYVIVWSTRPLLGGGGRRDIEYYSYPEDSYIL